MKIKIDRKMLFVIVILIVIAVVVVSASGYFGNNGPSDEFAKCLSEKGVTMYGAEWCGHCKEQKKMFGGSFKYVNYVECPENEALCQEKGITGYPTWIMNEMHYPGVQSLERLSQLTGCPLS